MPRPTLTSKELITELFDDICNSYMTSQNLDFTLKRFNITSYSFFIHASEEQIKKLKEIKKSSRKQKCNQYKVRVTTFLHGSTKNKFFDDLERTGNSEACLASEIIIAYYKKQI